ncbi:hypothetical protein [Butyrivibrio sp. AE2032]|uniref:hypothetical protein n=1 Tax=Butyrivibrio sp. AE2032 TaxID=1458463 RepID=UPI000550802A|nr:hypothetical protein [Butyrivibrio sp. AE2032]
MPQIKKEAKVMNMKLDKSVHEKLERFCGETGLSKTAATEKILDKYLTEYFERPEGKRSLF